jgi:hypothetical protein
MKSIFNEDRSKEDAGRPVANALRIVAAVNADINGSWIVERRLAGGSNEGAHLVRGADGARAVLKWRASEPERLVAAAPWVEFARDKGWPTPAWYAVGRAPTGEAWVLQEFIEGSQPPAIDRHVADQMIEIFDIQAGLTPAAAEGWGDWIARVMFEDWEGLRGRVHPLPGGERIVRSVDAIAEKCKDEPLCSGDLVHGDFNLTNTLSTPKGLWFIDVESLGPGPRVYDLAKTLVVAGIFGHATDVGLRRLWSYAESFDPREFALCAGSGALKIAEGIVRHGLYADAPVILSEVSTFLDRVRRLISA